jgi:hypothetical protein
MTMTPELVAALREPFKPEQIGKLPRAKYKDNKTKGMCLKTTEAWRGGDGVECGKWHDLPAVHLDYVGHAAVTERLLTVDSEWTWAPLAVDSTGAPVLDGNGGIWINLTVCGKTMPGYGDADGKKGGAAVKEAIGDAIRNAAMRFGIALELWAKEPLAGSDAVGDAETRKAAEKAAKIRDEILHVATQKGMKPAELREDFTFRTGKTSTECSVAELEEYLAALRTGTVPQTESTQPPPPAQVSEPASGGGAADDVVSADAPAPAAVAPPPAAGPGPTTDEVPDEIAMRDEAAAATTREEITKLVVKATRAKAMNKEVVDETGARMTLRGYLDRRVKAITEKNAPQPVAS